jgi:hypothetical protein
MNQLKCTHTVEYIIIIIYQISFTCFGACCIILGEKSYHLLKTICLLECTYIGYKTQNISYVGFSVVYDKQIKGEERGNENCVLRRNSAVSIPNILARKSE